MYLTKSALRDCLKVKEAFTIAWILQLQCFQCHSVLNWKLPCPLKYLLKHSHRYYGTLHLSKQELLDWHHFLILNKHLFLYYYTFFIWSSPIPFGGRDIRVPVAFSFYFLNGYNHFCFLLAYSPQLITDKYPIAFHIKTCEPLFQYCLLSLRPLSWFQPSR